MDAFSKNLASLGSKVKEQATDFAEKHELDKKAAEAKAKGDEFVKRHSLDEKAVAAKSKVETFAKDHEIDVKAANMKGKAEVFATEHELDTKAAEAMAKVEGFVKDHDLDTKAAYIVKSAENALGYNITEVAVYPEIVEQLGFKLTPTKAESEDTVAGVGGKVVGDSDATEDVAAKEKQCFSSKYAPSLTNIQEGSIADTLMKAKSKVFGGAAVGTGVAAGAALAASEKERMNNDAAKEEDAKDDAPDKMADVNNSAAFNKVMEEANEPYSGPGDVTMELLKEHAENIASEMEKHTKEFTDKEDIQKVLVPLMAKLSCAKNKFHSMSSKKKEKIEGVEEEGEEGAAATEKKEDGAAPAEEKEEESEKLPSEYAANDLKFRAEKAAKKAFENAERIAKKVAIKVGIIKVAEDTQEGIEVALEEETTDAPASTDDKESKAE